MMEPPVGFCVVEITTNEIEVRYVVPSDDKMVAPYMEDILYKKPLQPHARGDMQFGDTGDVFDKLREELRGQMTELQCNNKELTVRLKDLKSQLLDLKQDRNSQINQLICVQAKATEKSEAHSVGNAPQQEKVTDIEQNINRKGKGKMNPTDETEYPLFPPTPSFDFGVA
ncbi:Hypothetical predicted protein [Olea europaea subsp. europaea]|uniref:Uncharacterized protein n=1 Tax=Olea europaea subsp. europaea TaxID=158383 RepID=A0A8S0RAD0_OLEEU|nr:Hypothetical predicted protein [Olea europaea subsp. europaea]